MSDGKFSKSGQTFLLGRNKQRRQERPSEQPPYCTREAAQDKRTSQGDDYNGDAWRNSSGKLFWVVPGHNPNNKRDSAVRAQTCEHNKWRSLCPECSDLK